MPTFAERIIERIKEYEKKLRGLMHSEARDIEQTEAELTEIPEEKIGMLYSPWTFVHQKGGICHLILFDTRKRNILESEALLISEPFTDSNLGEVIKTTDLFIRFNVSSFKALKKKIAQFCLVNKLEIIDSGYFLKKKISFLEAKRISYARKTLDKKILDSLRLINKADKACSFQKKPLYACSALKPLSSHEYKTLVSLVSSQSCRIVYFPWTKYKNLAFSAFLEIFSQDLDRFSYPALFLFRDRKEAEKFKKEFSYYSEYFLDSRNFFETICKTQIKLVSSDKEKYLDRLELKVQESRKEIEKILEEEKNLEAQKRLLEIQKKKLEELEKQRIPISDYLETINRIYLRYSQLYFKYEEQEKSLFKFNLRRIAIIKKLEKNLERELYNLPINGETAKEKALKCKQIAETYRKAFKIEQEYASLKRRIYVNKKEVLEAEKRVASQRETLKQLFIELYHNFNKINYETSRKYAENCLLESKHKAALKRNIIEEIKTELEESQTPSLYFLKQKSLYYMSAVFQAFPVLIADLESIDDILEFCPSQFFTTFIFDSDLKLEHLKTIQKSRKLFLFSSYFDKKYKDLKEVYLYEEYPRNKEFADFVNYNLNFPIIVNKEELEPGKLDRYSSRSIITLSGEYSKKDEKRIKNLITRQLKKAEIERNLISVKFSDNLNKDLNIIKKEVSNTEGLFILLTNLKEEDNYRFHKYLSRYSAVIDTAYNHIDIDDRYIEISSLASAYKTIESIFKESSRIIIYVKKIDRFFPEWIHKSIKKSSAEININYKEADKKLLERLKKYVLLNQREVEESYIETESLIIKSEIPIFEDLTADRTFESELIDFILPKTYIYTKTS